jgi:hypothetical protein
VRLLRQRLETLETKAAPRILQVVPAFGNETWEQARARYGKPIAITTCWFGSGSQPPQA